MGRIGLDGLVGGLGRLLVAAALEMPECQARGKRRRPRDRTGSGACPLAPFDRALGFSGPSENDAAKDIGQRR